MVLSYRDIDIALDNGLINLIPNPYEKGVSCQIGDLDFPLFEQISVKEAIAKYDRDYIIREISAVMYGYFEYKPYFYNRIKEKIKGKQMIKHSKNK